MNQRTTPTHTRLVRTCLLAALVAFLSGSPGLLSPSWKIPNLPEVPQTMSPSSEAEGVVHGPLTLFDDWHPTLSGLRPEILFALRQAATDAQEEGITFEVNSGWRSRKYQNRLLEEAITRYGSEREAARWVATADTSPHVSGDAVDLGPSSATAWLSMHGSRYGLCQIYHNEPWHFELRPQAKTGGCPPMYADPTRDPRMQ